MSVHYDETVGRVAGLSSEGTRERVLDAAAAVFAESGFEGARVAHIAKTADLSVGAIYNHYESKAELLAAVVERHSAADLAQLMASRQPGGVLDLIAARGEQLNDRPPASPLLAEMILASSRDPEVAAVLVREASRQERLLADFVRLAQSAGDVVDDVEPSVVARFCLMLGLGSLMVQALDLPHTDSDAWASFINRLVAELRHEEDNDRPGP